MELLCHRCGNTLHEGEGFCPHCGVPQLVVDTSEPLGPQPPTQRVGVDPSRVEWRVAIASALLVAAPVGFLSVVAGQIRTPLVLAAGFGAIALYRRRSETATDGSIGWKVGALVGIIAALLATATYATELVISRYWLHDGAAMDREFQAAAKASVDYMMKTSAQQGPQPPEVVHMLQGFAAFVLSPDGHAASQLGAAASMSLGMVLFAATGGAIAGRILSIRPRAQRSL